MTARRFLLVEAPVIYHVRCDIRDFRQVPGTGATDADRGIRSGGSVRSHRNRIMDLLQDDQLGATIAGATFVRVVGVDRARLAVTGRAQTIRCNAIVHEVVEHDLGATLG